MPTYVYKNPDKEEYLEITQGINEAHEYIRDGIFWERQFTVPNMSVDSKINPFSESQFVERTGRMKGNLGDMMDASKELSEKRSHILGSEDPVRRKKFDEYSKKRGGKLHPQDPQKLSKLDSLGVSLS